MAIRAVPELHLLRKMLEYDHSTGKFYWIFRTPDMFSDSARGREWACHVWNTKNAGNEALNRPHGVKGSHLSGTLCGGMWLAHRIAWAMHHNVRVFDVIDHIDGDGTNNLISNLRIANHAINARNAKRRADSTSGVTGVNWRVPKFGQPRWEARIQLAGRRIDLGRFSSLEDAIRARREAERLYDFGPSHGFSKE
jgi:hypothetical protein